MFDVLKEKHPDPAPFDERAVEGGDEELPALMDVSVTSDYVERVATWGSRSWWYKFKPLAEFFFEVWCS